MVSRPHAAEFSVPHAAEVSRPHAAEASRSHAAEVSRPHATEVTSSCRGKRPRPVELRSSVQVSSSGLTTHDLQLGRSYLLRLNFDLGVLELYGKPIESRIH